MKVSIVLNISRFFFGLRLLFVRCPYHSNVAMVSYRNKILHYVPSHRTLFNQRLALLLQPLRSSEASIRCSVQLINWIKNSFSSEFDWHDITFCLKFIASFEKEKQLILYAIFLLQLLLCLRFYFVARVFTTLSISELVTKHLACCVFILTEHATDDAIELLQL